jgi:hypothetical protein
LGNFPYIWPHCGLRSNTVARWGRAGQGRAGQGRAGQGRAGQGRAGQGRAGQGRQAGKQTVRTRPVRQLAARNNHPSFFLSAAAVSICSYR